MKSIRYFFALLLFSIIAYAMEEREDGSKVRKELNFLRSSINQQTNDEILQSNPSNFLAIEEESGEQPESVNLEHEQNAEIESKDKKAKSIFEKLKDLRAFSILKSYEKSNDIETNVESSCCLLEMLPIEILIYIGNHILDENEIRKSVAQRKKILKVDLEKISQKELEQLLSSKEPYAQAIKDHLNFAQALAADNRYKLDIRRKKEQYLGFIIKCGINPFFMAQKLKITYTREEKDKYKKLALENECKKRDIAQCQLEEWLNKNKDYNNAVDEGLLFELIRFYEKHSIIGFLAILQILDLDNMSAIRPKGFTISSPTKFKANEIGAKSCLAHWAIETNSPLIWAICFKRHKIIKILLNTGIDPNCATEGICVRKAVTGQALRCAVYLRDRKSVQLLLEAGANPNDDSWYPALDIAMYPEKDEIISKILIARKAKSGRGLFYWFLPTSYYSGVAAPIHSHDSWDRG